MQNELKIGEYIEEFVSVGPKNYAYRVVIGIDATKPVKRVCKVRGITLNYNASKLVNFDVIRKMILNGARSRDVMTVHTDKKMKRGWGRRSIYNHRARRQNLQGILLAETVLEQQ
jgi:hypothetical protein